jgi:hypothetical protein
MRLLELGIRSRSGIGHCTLWYGMVHYFTLLLGFAVTGNHCYRKGIHPPSINFGAKDTACARADSNTAPLRSWKGGKWQLLPVQQTTALFLFVYLHVPEDMEKAPTNGFLHCWEKYEMVAAMHVEPQQFPTRAGLFFVLEMLEG